MSIRLCAIALATLVPAVAAAYPLYFIGTEVRGGEQDWQYSGKGSDGQPWSNAHAPADQVRSAIGATFLAFDQGSAKDAGGNACSTLTFVETTPDGGATDRLAQEGRWTEGIFVSDQRDPEYQYMQGGTVAFALPTPDDNGYVVDCDTVYNAVDMPFSTDGSALSIQGIGMQETAHCFGLHHVCQQSPGDGQPPCDGADVDTHSVMFPFADPGFGADVPDGRDQDNMCQIYPVNGIGRPCDPAGTGPEGEPVGFATPDCVEGTACACTAVGQICTKSCLGDTDCPADSKCEEGSCVPDFYPGTEHTGVPTRTGFGCDTNHQLHKPMGAPCASDADCGAEETCLTGVDGGYCSFDCSNAACPSDGECVGDVVTAGDAFCLKPCTFDQDTCDSSECPSGQVCRNLGSGTEGVCFSPCRTDADCDTATPAQAVCDTSTGMCHPKRTDPVCGPHRNDPIPPVCIPKCDRVKCGGSDGCGGTCGEGSGCVKPPPSTGTKTAKPKTGCASAGASTLALAGLALFFLRRRRPGQVVAAATAALVAFGCGPKPTADGTSTVPPKNVAVTAQNFHDQQQLAYCDYAKRCAPVLAHVYCASDGSSTVAADLAAGRLGFDPALATRCVADVRDSACQPDPFLGASLSAAAECDEAVPPKVADGGACDADHDCQGGWCDLTKSCPGVCAKAAAAGEDCTSAKCAAGSYCSPRSGTCVALKADAGSCFFDQQCQSSFCHVDLASGSGACAEPQGETAGMEGDPCSAFADCGSGLYCAFDPSTLDGQQYPSGICQKRISAGVVCGSDGDWYGVENACADGLACVGFSLPTRASLRDPALPGVCLAWSDVGGRCTPVRDGAGAAVTGCMYGLVCGADGQCALPTAGSPCGVDQYSGCIEGESCDYNAGRCAPEGADAAQCIFDDQCTSHSCVEGSCAAVCQPS